MSGVGKGPARGYKWEPFKPGHELSVRHGAYASKRVDPVAQELVAAVLEDESLGYLQAPAYLPAVWAWARAEAQVQLVTDYLAELVERAGGTMSLPLAHLHKPQIKAAVELLHRAEARAESGRKRLGLDPLSRARLGRDVMSAASSRVDIAKAMALLAKSEETDDDD